MPGQAVDKGYVSAEREMAFTKIGKVWCVRRYKRSPGSFASRLNCEKRRGAVEGQRIILQAESVFSTLRRAGVRAKYQRLCRHALCGRGCGLDIALHWQSDVVTSVAANAVTIPQAAEMPDGWYRGGVIRFGSQLGFITDHAGAILTLSRPMLELAAAIATPDLDPDTGDPLPGLADIAPGCDLRAATCAAKFGNLSNFGGFPEIPGRNPFGGRSIV